MKMTIFCWDNRKNYLSMVLEFSYFDTKIRKQRPEKNAVNLSEPITISIIYCEKAKDRMERENKMEKEISFGYVLRFHDLMRIFAQPLNEKKKETDRKGNNNDRCSVHIYVNLFLVRVFFFFFFFKFVSASFSTFASTYI